MKIGRYNVISELGRGAMGIVYKAADPTIGREVAMKVLAFDPGAKEGTVSPQDLFMREVRTAGRLAHPAIVAIHDAFEDPKTHACCIVMEFVPGRTLESILLSGYRLSVEQTFSIVRQVAEGLDYAHRNQVVHRDLKPANILVMEDGHAKITDFGIAKVLAREGTLRTAGFAGTPSYMAPEQVRGGDIDSRADLFSLGIIFYTILTGQKPFVGDAATVMFKIVYEDPPVPSSLNPQLNLIHDYMVMRCLAKDRDKRYASAREFLNDLSDVAQGYTPRSRGAAAWGPAATRLEEQTLIMGGQTPLTAAPSQPAKAAAPPRPREQTKPLAAPSLSDLAPPAPARMSTPPAPAAPSPPVAAPAPSPTLATSMFTVTSPPQAAPVAPPAPPQAQPAPLRRPPPLPSPQATVLMPQPVAPQPAQPIVARAPAPPWARLIFILLIVGGVAVALLAAVGVGVWKFRQSRRAHVAPPQVAVVPQPPPAPSPEAALPATNVPNPEIAPTTPTTSTAPASPAPQVERKTVVRKPKPAAKPQPEAVEPAPAPPPPAPLAVAPPPQPAPAAPSPEAIAKAEAAKFANVPHIVQLQCEYELKEATYTISGGGQTLYQGVFKGKKKGGFMGIKGAYEGSFSHTITVPAGAAEVSVHVTTKDRSIELNKAIPMPSAVGFIPTLDVKVAEDHITLAWQSPPKPKP